MVCKKGLIGFVLAAWCFKTASAACDVSADIVPLKIGNTAFMSEIASTPRSMQRGLMFREWLPENAAMLFLYQHPQPVSFWMKNTLIPLDILFFDARGYLVEIKYEVPPCVADPCPVYPSRHQNIQYVVELNAGIAKKRDIRIGDRLQACFFDAAR